MQDFIRIGGAINSSPLNENFRRLLNAISISNTNLIFPEENAIVDTITDMHAIKEPLDAQTCYVISSGELYRYTKAGNGDWIKIADFGQTFRQGFLNSGAVVLEDYVKLKTGSKKILSMPNMLVYFKNKPGDKKYLKGMYGIEAQEVSLPGFVNKGGAYSFYVDELGEYHFIEGLPQEDNVNKVYIGSFVTDSKGEILEDFVYTLPDIAYTADRGYFLMHGGEASGCNLVASEEGGTKVNRKAGYYYDEGINFPIGGTEEFPYDCDNGSNFDLKYYENQTPVNKIYYMTPVDGLNNNFTISTTGLIPNKYWDKDTGTLKDVPDGSATIQQHLVTPNGQDIILYGSEVYNSLDDAISHINSVFGAEVSFPYIEATRIALVNTTPFNASDSAGTCRFITLGRLSQVGTISPKFSDVAFELYSADAGDAIPAVVKISLAKLQEAKYDDTYTLKPLGPTIDHKFFGLSQKYLADGVTPVVVTNRTEPRQDNGADGYLIADHQDIVDIITRLNDIEAEIWEIERADAKERYDQSIRYRLFHAEDRLDGHDAKLEQYGQQIDYLEKYKVHKNTTVNGYKLGDGTANDEAKAVVLQTGDIAEGSGLTGKTNQWYTEARVSANVDVVASRNHRNTTSKTDDATSHTKVNPHNLSTDDLNILTGTTRLFVTPEEERRIRADRLPDNTIQALADLDAKNLDTVQISTLDGNGANSTGKITNYADVKGIRFYEDGVELSKTSDGNTLIVEVKGQVDEDTVMLRNIYAQQEMLDPELLEGYVDKAVLAATAYDIYDVTLAGPDQYYGTNAEGVPGTYDIQKFVTTANATDYTDIDQITFVPINGSVSEAHLDTALTAKLNNNYHTIFNTGVLKSNEINTLNFGDNLTVDIDGHTATINATGSGSGTGGVSNFANLHDVDVTYTGNAGKTLIINEDETGITYYDAPPLNSYMLKTIYVDPSDITKVKKAAQADNATLATTATNAQAVNNKVVDDSQNTTGVLWTASKIKSNTTAQIQAEGVNTYSGTTVPANSLGKNGDIYILIEG